MSKVSEPRNEVRPSAPRAGAQAGSNGPSGSPPLGSDRASDRGHLSPQTERSWWQISRDLSYPWMMLFLVWRFGLHWTIILTGIAFVAAALIAIGQAIEANRRG